MFDGTREARMLVDLGWCGKFLRFKVGGRSGQGHILGFLDMNGGSAQQRDLVDEFALKPATLSEMLAKLQAEGMVVRTRDANDSRKLIVELTEQGKQAATMKRRRMEEFETRAFTCFSEKEQDELSSMLERLKDYWETIDD